MWQLSLHSYQQHFNRCIQAGDTSQQQKTSATGILPAAVSAVTGPTPGLEADLSVGKR